MEMWLRVAVPSSFGLAGLTHYWTLELLFNSTLNTAQLRFTIAPSDAQYDSAPFVMPFEQFVHFACSVVSGQLLFAIDGTAISAHLWDALAWPASGPLPNSSLFVGGAGNELEPLIGLVNEVPYSTLRWCTE